MGLMALSLLPASLAAVTVAKGEGDTFVVASPIYQATLDAKTGLLKSMAIDGTTVLTGMTIDANGVGEIDKRELVQEGPAKVVAYLSVKKKDGKISERMLRLAYEAEDGVLTIKILANEGGGSNIAGRGPTFTFGPEAQMVRSLEFKETLPLPILQWRAPWMQVKYYFANGATLGLLNSGAGNPFNADENGNLNQYSYSRGGYVANSEYVYRLIAEKGGAKTLGSPAMTIAEAATPAVYWQGDPIQASIKIGKAHYQKLAGLTGLRVKYEVQDAFGKEVAKGAVPLDLAGGADPVELKVPLEVKKLGWYRAYFTVNDAKDSLLEGKERLIFSVLKHQANMGERFDNQIQTDYTIGLGFIRLHPNLENTDEAAKNADQWVAEAQGTDVTLDYQIDGPPGSVGNDPKKFGELMAKAFAKLDGKVPQIEIINEPNGTLEAKAYVETFLRPAYENIKRVAPTTKVIGPVLCGIGPDQARYLDELYKLGLKNLTDELSFHPYCGNFDDGNAPEAMRRLIEIITANGDAQKPRHFTEAGYGHNGWSDLASMREVVKLAVSQYTWQNAIMGIDYRHNFYYFTDTMGYLTWWLRATQLTPGAVGLRTHTGFVKGQDRAQQLSLGSLEAVRAFLYPGEQKQVVVLWTVGNYLPADAADPVTPVAFKTDAAKVEYFDCFGNPLPAEVKNGTVSLSVGTYPSYLVVAGKPKLEPVPEPWGSNVALTALGSTAEATSEQGTSPAVGAIDGNTASMTAWRSLNANELPQSITVSLAGLTPVDRVGIWSYSPRGYDVEVMGADGAWVKVVSLRDQPYQRFRANTFKAVITDQIRLTVVDSYTNFVEVAELQVFSPESKGQAMQLVNWALKANGATAKASSEMKKEVSVAEMDWGAKTPRIVKSTLHGKAENAIDGKRLNHDWRDFFPTTWIAAADQPLPQWLEIDLAGPKQLTNVTVYTIAFSCWTPATSGIRAWDVQVWDGKDWKTVDSVKDNVKVSKISRFKTPVTTDKIRIVVNATNDPMGTVGIMEVEAFGPK
jgi:hypothetical protein